MRNWMMAEAIMFVLLVLFIVGGLLDLANAQWVPNPGPWPPPNNPIIIAK